MSELVERVARALCFVIFAAPAHAGWFVEGATGSAFAPLSSVRYDDPVGATFTVNRVDARGIVPGGTKRRPWSPGGMMGVGYEFPAGYFLRGDYRHFGNTSAVTEGIVFGPSLAVHSLPFPQAISAGVQGVFLWGGYRLPIGQDWDISGAVGGGAILSRSDGTRDIGLPIQQPFPARGHLGFGYGVELAVGRRLADSVSVRLGVAWHELGQATTAWSPDIGGAPLLHPGVPPVARIRARLETATALLGVRYEF